MKIHHVQLAMPGGREDDARRFYVGVLGFEELPKPDELRERGGAWFRSGEAEVHLGVEQDFRAAKKAHPALLADDLASLVARCNEAGFPATPDDLMPGYKRAYVQDPFGNRIELLEAAHMAEVIHEFSTPVRGFTARAYAEERGNVWIGYLEFSSGGNTRRTGEETSQPSRDAVTYWASGLEPVYLEGALGRAK